MSKNREPRLHLRKGDRVRTKTPGYGGEILEGTVVKIRHSGSYPDSYIVCQWDGYNRPFTNGLAPKDLIKIEESQNR